MSVQANDTFIQLPMNSRPPLARKRSKSLSRYGNSGYRSEELLQTGVKFNEDKSDEEKSGDSDEDYGEIEADFELLAVDVHSTSFSKSVDEFDTKGSSCPNFKTSNDTLQNHLEAAKQRALKRIQSEQSNSENGSPLKATTLAKHNSITKVSSNNVKRVPSNSNMSVGSTGSTNSRASNTFAEYMARAKAKAELSANGNNTNQTNPPMRRGSSTTAASPSKDTKTKSTLPANTPSKTTTGSPKKASTSPVNTTKASPASNKLSTKLSVDTNTAFTSQGKTSPTTTIESPTSNNTSINKIQSMEPSKNIHTEVDFSPQSVESNPMVTTEEYTSVPFSSVLESQSYHKNSESDKNDSPAKVVDPTLDKEALVNPGLAAVRARLNSRRSENSTSFYNNNNSSQNLNASLAASGSYDMYEVNQVPIEANNVTPSYSTSPFGSAYNLYNPQMHMQAQPLPAVPMSAGMGSVSGENIMPTVAPGPMPYPMMMPPYPMQYPGVMGYQYPMMYPPTMMPMMMPAPMMVSAQPTSSLPLDEADEREIQLIMNEGYTHAVATEIYLNRLASRQQMHMMNQRNNQTTMTVQADTTDDHSLTFSQHSASNTIQSSVQDSAKLEAARVAIMINQQNQQFGTNMYDSLTESDEPKLQQLIAEGQLPDDAILAVFESKGYRMQYDFSTLNKRLRSPKSSNSSAVGANSISPQKAYQHVIQQQQLQFASATQYRSVPAIAEVNHSRDLYDAPMATVVEAIPINGHPSDTVRRQTISPATNTIMVRSTTASPMPPTAAENNSNSSASNNVNTATTSEQGKSLKKTSSFHKMKSFLGLAGGKNDEVNAGNSAVKSSEEKQQKKLFKYKEQDVKQIMRMGYSREMAVQALIQNNNDVNAAVDALLEAAMNA